MKKKLEEMKVGSVEILVVSEAVASVVVKKLVDSELKKLVVKKLVDSVKVLEVMKILSIDY